LSFATGFVIGLCIGVTIGSNPLFEKKPWSKLNKKEKQIRVALLAGLVILVLFTAVRAL